MKTETRTKISATVRTRNEEANLEECLKSIAWSDEIIVVDSRSTDRTIEIARKYTDKIYVRDWPGHIAQSQFATDQASNVWVLSMDADERVTPELRDEILALHLDTTPHDAFEMPRRHFFMKRWINHSAWYPDYKIRLFRKDRCHWGGYNPHDEVKVKGTKERLKRDLIHYIYRDIEHFAATKNTYSTLTARDHFKNGRTARIINFTLRPLYAFLYRYFIRLGFLDGIAGFTICVEEAHGVFLKYVKLYELQKRLYG
jgi:glycosyltransferase involved in cell wall biosynthesis